MLVPKRTEPKVILYSVKIKADTTISFVTLSIKLRAY